jgi:hypothetical protein
MNRAAALATNDRVHTGESPIGPAFDGSRGGVLSEMRVWLRYSTLVALAALLPVSAMAMADGWLRVLGGPAFEEAFREQVPGLLKSPLTPERFADEALAAAAFVAYKASHDPLYLNRAKEVANFLISNSNLAGDGVPGWGPKLSKGYGFCPDADNFRGRDLWETTRALNAILKTHEVAPTHAYVEMARNAVDHWPSEEKRLVNQGPYASAGMRFSRKEPESCARRYVKNTNLAMGEVLYRLARQTGERRYGDYAEQVLNAELWEILTRKNFGYHGAMIYVDPQVPQNQQVLKSEQRKVQIRRRQDHLP